jgi:tetratricopeptide (TPR) repeat protein
LADHEEAMILQEQTFAMHSRNHKLAENQTALAKTFSQRYVMPSALNGLQRSIELASDSVLIREGHHGNRSISPDILGVLYAIVISAIRSGDLVGLDRVIECFEKILTPLDNSHPGYPKALSNLAATLRTRYLHTDSLPNLERAIELLQESSALLPAASHLDRYSVPTNLSAALDDRFGVFGNWNDENATIALIREVLPMRPLGHVSFQGPPSDRANRLSQRYRRNENQEDVAEAISLYEEVLVSFGPGQRGPVCDRTVIKLADLLVIRHRFTGSRADLDRAITLHDRLFQQGTKEAVTEALGLHGAANALLCRFRLSHNDADLAGAISKLEAGLAFHHTRRYAILHDLSYALQLRFHAKGAIYDIKAAMKYQTMALECVPAGHPGRSRVLYGLARIHAAKDTPYHDFPLALEHTARALHDMICGVQSRIQDFLDLLPDITSAASQHEEVGHKLLEVFRHALQLLPKMAFLGRDVRERLRMLRQTEHLAILSADLALRLKRPNDAIEVLEEGRAVFWTQYLRLRTKFDLLPSHLANELVRLIDQIGLGTQRFQHHSSGDDYKKDRAIEDAAVVANRQLAAQFKLIVKEARLLPGFERFLLHEPYSTLSRVSEHCPAVILVALRDSCAAILIRGPGTLAEHVSLPDITAEQLQNMARTIQNANRGVRGAWKGRAIRKVHPQGDGVTLTLHALWERVARPLVKAIGLPVRNVFS